MPDTEFRDLRGRSVAPLDAPLPEAEARELLLEATGTALGELLEAWQYEAGLRDLPAPVESVDL